MTLSRKRGSRTSARTPGRASSSRTVPPCARTSSRTIARPSPVPPPSRARRVVESGEPVEDPLPLRPGDAGAVVGHGERRTSCPSAAPSRSTAACGVAGPRCRPGSARPGSARPARPRPQVHSLGPLDGPRWRAARQVVSHGSASRPVPAPPAAASRSSTRASSSRSSTSRAPPGPGRSAGPSRDGLPVAQWSRHLDLRSACWPAGCAARARRRRRTPAAAPGPWRERSSMCVERDGEPAGSRRGGGTGSAPSVAAPVIRSAAWR